LIQTVFCYGSFAGEFPNPAWTCMDDIQPASHPASPPSSKRVYLNETRMMSIIRSAMEVIITVDEAQRIVIFNPMAEKVFACSAMDAIGTSLSRFIPERFREHHGRHVKQFGVTGVSDRQMGQQRVLFGLRANGEEFPIEASISQVYGDEGKLYTVMLRDVTERVKTENSLRASQDELQRLSANIQNVREEEKTRIARELHDDLGQQLTALKMDVSMLASALKDSGAAADLYAKTQAMHSLIDATVASVRRIAADLRPVMLDDLGPVPAIEWLINDFTQRYGIEVTMHIHQHDFDFNPTAGTALFRIVQEALTNVARHAGATRVTVRLSRQADQCVVWISDNGHGVEPDAMHKDKSFGLLGIRERTRMLGGTLSLDTAPGRGFSLTVSLPLQAVEQQSGQS
jgi:two-component system, NarL family, sensor histidine kinase UhpB